MLVELNEKEIQMLIDWYWVINSAKYAEGKDDAGLFQKLNAALEGSPTIGEEL